MLVSIASGRGLISVMLLVDGVVVEHKTISASASCEDSVFVLIDAFSFALRMARNYMQVNGMRDYVVFETSNSIFIKWMEKGYAKDRYQEKFAEFERLLNELPIKYSVIHNKKPSAKMYLGRKYIHREKITGLEV